MWKFFRKKTSVIDDRVTHTLIVSSLLGISFVLARMWFTDSPRYGFLFWNLFLAWIPYLCSLKLLELFKAKKHIFWIYVCGVLWLIFFPNTPYLITDFKHLPAGKIDYIWYDIVLLCSFAWTGLLLTFLSLGHIHYIFKEKIGSKKTWLIITFLFLLTSFGIYLGRFLRWNSWDIVASPYELIGDILDRASSPFAHPQTIAFIIAFSAFLMVGYWSFHTLTHTKDTRD